MSMERENDNIRLQEGDRLQELKDGEYVMTPGGAIADIEVPLWYDEKLFNEAKRVYKEYFASVNFSHLCGLLLSFYFAKNIKTLRSTGESETKYNLFHRYLATIRHTQKWYEGDVWNPKDPANKSLATVRTMHARAASKMAGLNDGIVYVSQWDMAVTQWAFVGPMILFRSKVGLHSCTEEQYESLIHFWRVIGYLLGIEDQYNLCSGNYDQVVAVCKSMLEKEYKEHVANPESDSVSMGKNVMDAMNMIDAALTWPSMSNYIHDLVGVLCPDTMNYMDWIFHRLMKFVIVFVFQFPIPRSLANNIFRWRLNMANKRDLEFQKQRSITHNIS